jgi:cobalt-zinc-cadmium efflux system protein
MSHHHHHHHSPDSSDGLLVGAISINLILTLAQFIGGIISGSLSLIADALHNLSDAASLGIAIFARKISRKPADNINTFGYKRAEVVAALINLTLLIVISLYLIYEAIWRIYFPVEISGWIIVIIAGIALLIDLLTALITHSLSKNNLNMKAAFLHNLSDAFASIGVILAGTLIIIYQWYWVDTLVTLLIGGFILYQGILMLPKTIHLLMEGAPEGVSIDEVKARIESLEHVIDAHHIHLWSIDESKIALEAHIVTDNAKTLSELESIKASIKSLLSLEFNISHSTLEFEDPSIEHCD